LGLVEIVRHFIGYHSTQRTKVHIRGDDPAGNICLALADGRCQLLVLEAAQRGLAAARRRRQLRQTVVRRDRHKVHGGGACQILLAMSQVVILLKNGRIRMRFDQGHDVCRLGCHFVQERRVNNACRSRGGEFHNVTLPGPTQRQVSRSASRAASRSCWRRRPRRPHRLWTWQPQWYGGAG